MSKAQHKKQFFLLSLGCSKNTVDSNSMADLLLRAGFDAADDPDDASVLIVNTCGFIESARQESVGALRERSVRLSEYLIGRWQERLEPLGFRLNSPRDPARRGSHVSLGHPEGLRVNLALIHDQHVLPDFRRPDNIRLGIAPLYNTFADLHTAVERLRAVVVDRLYERYDATGLTVT